METDFLGAHDLGSRLSDTSHQTLASSIIHLTMNNKRNTHSGVVKNIEIKLEGEEKSESGNITNRSGASVTLYQKMQDNLIQQRKNVSISKASHQNPPKINENHNNNNNLAGPAGHNHILTSFNTGSNNTIPSNNNSTHINQGPSTINNKKKSSRKTKNKLPINTKTK